MKELFFPLTKLGHCVERCNIFFVPYTMNNLCDSSQLFKAWQVRKDSEESFIPVTMCAFSSGL